MHALSHRELEYIWSGLLVIVVGVAVGGLLAPLTAFFSRERWGTPVVVQGARAEGYRSVVASRHRVARAWPPSDVISGVAIVCVWGSLTLTIVLPLQLFVCDYLVLAGQWFYLLPAIAAAASSVFVGLSMPVLGLRILRRSAHLSTARRLVRYAFVHYAVSLVGFCGFIALFASDALGLVCLAIVPCAAGAWVTWRLSVTASVWIPRAVAAEEGVPT